MQPRRIVESQTISVLQEKKNKKMRDVRQFNIVTALPRELVRSVCLYPLIFFHSLCLEFIWIVAVVPMGVRVLKMFLFLSWPVRRARFPAIPQKADNTGICALRKCLNQAQGLLAHDLKWSKRTFLPRLFLRHILSVIFTFI